MPRVALVLSGGGSKGAFQFGAEKYAREAKGYHWDIIAGISVGALNGAMLAMGKHERLEEIWRTVTRKQVYTGRLDLWAVVRLLFGAKSIYNNKPLWKLIQGEVEPDLIHTDLRIGAVSLRTGEYVRFGPQDRGFLRAVLASTAIPVVWAPVDVSPGRKDMVDGGLRDVSPLGDVLDADPDEVVIINCQPRMPPATYRSPRNALEVGQAAIDIALHEIFENDLREFLRINRLVQEAAAHGVTLHKEDGRPFKFYRHVVIEPDRPLGDSLDFARSVLDERIEAGWEAARRVLG